MDKLSMHHLNVELAHRRGRAEPAEHLQLLPLFYHLLYDELRGIRDRIGTKAVGEDTGVLPPDIAARFAKCHSIIEFLEDTVDPDAGKNSLQLSQLNSLFHRRTRAAEKAKDGRIIDEILTRLEKISVSWVGE